MTIPNYLALYNLSQIEADILIVADLTATTGTIYTLFSNTGTITTLNSTTGTITTLNSTTGNITTANITTANITTLITDLWRGTTTSSSMVIGLSGDTGTLTSYRSLIMDANKTITLNATGGVINCDTFQGTSASSAISLFQNTTGNSIIIGNTSNGNAINPQMTIAMATGKNITITATGNLQVETIRGATLSNPVSLYLAQTGAISFGNNLGTGGGITFNDNITLPANRTITLNTTGGKILCNVYTGRTSSSNITIGEVFDSGNLSIYKTIASSNTYSGDNTYSGSNTFSGLNNTFNNTLSCNTFRGLTPAGNISLFSTTTGTTTLGSTSGGSFTINPSVILPANKSITLNATGGKILCNTLTGTTTSSTIEIGETGDTGLIRTRKDLYIGSTPFSSNKGIYCNYFDTLATTDTINFSATQTTGNINIQPSASSGSIVIGNTTPTSDSGTLLINKNTSIAVGKTLTISSTGNIICNTIDGIAPTSTIFLFNNIVAGAIGFATQLTGSMNLATSMRNGVLNIGGFSFNPGTDTGYITFWMPLDIQQNITLASGKNLTLSTSGKVVVNTIEGTAPADNIVLFSTTTGTLTLGNTGGGNFTINPNVVLASGKNLTLSSSGKVVVNTIEGTAAASNIVLFSTTTGTTTLGNTGGGSFTINPSVVLATGKTLTTSTTGSILCPTYNSTSATQALSLGTTNTTANVSLATGLTTGTLFIGPTVATSNNAYPQGWSVFNSNVYVIAGRRLTMDASSSGIFSPSIGHGGSNFAICNQAADNVANITIGSTQSTGNITLGNTTPASDSGTLTINKNTTLGTGKSITGSSTSVINCPAYRGLSATSSFGVGDNTTTGNIALGSSQTSGNVSFSNTSATGRVICNNKAEFTTATNSCYINTSTGVNLFTSTYLAGKPLSSNIYGGAPTDQWNVWDSNCENSLQDGSAICQNGNTTIIVNPGDQSTLWWIDEDIMTTATNYAITTGWKIATNGAITNLSDRRVKRNINPIIDENILDKLLQLELVKFQYKPPSPEKEYKNGKLRTKYTEYHSGYVAQNVNKVFPDACERVNADAYWMLKKDVVNDYYNLG
ncbi:MAG: tail fiber domain-containing protein, partial [Flavobacterium sp.]|uniref:tail fiber domain-containing protein n=1 Tax=Flavobacterium sp. TaxID=239 RepID=UPI003BE906FD